MRISENFTRDEFIRSEVADDLGYPVGLDKWILEQLERLVHTCLQPIRDSLGVPIRITSGYRPAWLNSFIRGARNSSHLYGCAADFETPGMDLTQAFNHIKLLNLPIDQLILENAPDGWIHLSIAMPGEIERNEFLLASRGRNGKMNYIQAG